MVRTRKQADVVGWREWISLPDFGVDALKAKVDTGARSSALHAFRLEIFEKDGDEWARFEVHPDQRRSSNAVVVEAPVAGWRKIRSSNGETEERPVIRTPIAIGPHRWMIDITLTNRDEMGFRMLLGRAAIKRRFLVEPGRSYLIGPRPQR